MSDHLLRQLTDIDVQSQKLLSKRMENRDLYSFSRYCIELKAFILENSRSNEVQQLANEIPDILRVDLEPPRTRFVIRIILGVISLGLSVVIYKHAAQNKKDRQIENNIRTAQGKFAGIAYILKAEA